MNGKGKATVAELTDVVDGADFVGEYTKVPPPPYPDYNMANKEVLKKQWAEYEKRSIARAKDIAKNFLATHKGKKIFTFTYSDHDRLGGVIEHGGLLERLPCIRISRH
jgi:hypothetical protein